MTICSCSRGAPAISIYCIVVVSRQQRSNRPAVALLIGLMLSACSCRAFGQNPTGSLPDAPTPQNQASDSTVTVRGTPLRILKDQEAIWTSPARIRESNALGPVVLVLATAIVMTTDHQVMSSSKLQNPSLNDEASTASTGLLGGFVAAPVAIYGLGALHHDDHATETGILGGEAMVDSLAVSEVLKAISMRERPTVDSAKGRLFQTSVDLDSSFPSNHAMVAWSSAAVIASEYDGAMTQILAYGLATGVSATRVLARQHFPSDVLVGSAVGWMIGRYVEHKHGRAN
jgi:hypothetical protein